MKKIPISICILAWKSAATLRNTFRSYQKHGLLNISDDITILFQEISESDKKIADKFGVKYMGLTENTGIGKGISKLASNAKYDTMLFLEHDWQLIENNETLISRLTSGIELLNSGYNVVRYRSRKNPGYPLYSEAHKGNELNYYDDWHQVTSPHLLDALHWLDPAEKFPDKIQRVGEYFITTARWANWTNNPFLIKKEFYLQTIAPFARESVHFEKNIAYWWARQEFKIAQGEGLFMHNDLQKHPPVTFYRKMLTKSKRLFRKLFT